jgi:hypothetical protein
MIYLASGLLNLNFFAASKDYSWVASEALAMSLTQMAATATTRRICPPFVSFNHPGHPGERNRGLRP